MKLKITLILFLLIQLSFAEKFDLTTDSTSYLIGQQAKFKLVYEGTENFKWPTLDDTLSADLEIVAFSKIDTISPGNYEQILYVTAWDTGYFIVPPIQSGTAQTAPSLVRFNTIQMNTEAGIKPINEQMNTPWIFDEIANLVYTILIAILLLCVITAIIIKQIKKRKPKAEPKTPTRPIMDVLWERFYTLAESKIWETGQEKEFQSELSLILRGFLEFKYNVKALEETTRNITMQLDALGLKRKFRDEVLHILNFSDMVKFAKQKGVYSQHENALNILEEMLKSHNTEAIG